MEIQIDREELQRIQAKQKARDKEAEDLILAAEFIEFVDEEATPDTPPSTSEVKSTDDQQSTSTVSKTSEASRPTPAKKPAKITSVLRYNVPWMSNPTRKYSLNPTERLHQEIIDFASYVSPTEEERFARSEAIRRLSEVVSAVWPHATVQVFGSFDSQMYLPSSDLDTVVILPEPLTSNNTSSTIVDEYTKPPLKKLAKALLKASIPIPETLKVLANARVPIVKYVDSKTDYELDVAFNVSSGLDASKFMRDQMRQFPALRPLTLVLKHYLEMRRLNEVFTGGLGSFSIMCLVLSFLQAHPLVQSGLIRAHENLGVLLMEFFELYGRNFNYETVGISVLDEGSYFDKADRDWVNENRPNALCIEDPQNPDNDLAKGSFAINAIRMAFEHAFNCLRCAFGEYDAQAGHQRPHGERREVSLLGSIVALSDKLLRHRYYIQQTANL